MKKSEFDKAMRELPKYHPVFRVVSTPKGTLAIVLERGDLVHSPVSNPCQLCGQAPTVVVMRNNTALGLPTRHLSFIGYYTDVELAALAKKERTK